MQEVYLPLLKLLPIDEGDDLKIYALNGRVGQVMPPCYCDKDAYFSVQQGQIRLDFEAGPRIMQAHESEFLPAGSVFQLESLTDSRAKLVMPVQASLSFDLPDERI